MDADQWIHINLKKAIIMNGIGIANMEAAAPQGTLKDAFKIYVKYKNAEEKNAEE